MFWKTYVVQDVVHEHSSDVIDLIFDRLHWQGNSNKFDFNTMIDRLSVFVADLLSVLFVKFCCVFWFRESLSVIETADVKKISKWNNVKHGSK